MQGDVAVDVVIICINLLSRVERRRKIVTWFHDLRSRYRSQFNLHLSLLEACDGVTQSLAQLNLRYGVRPYAGWAMSPENWQTNFPTTWRQPQSSGGIASTLSHLDAIRLAGNFFESISDPIVLVAEDDIDVTISDFLEFVVARVRETQTLRPTARQDESGWDMLLFGASDARSDIRDSQPLSDYLQVAGFTYMTTLYAVSRKCVEKFSNWRSEILANCLVFDELHNALAGHTARVRPDLKNLYGNEKLEILKISSNICRQAPDDCGHDTNVNAGSRAKSSEIGNRMHAQEISEPLFRYEVFMPDRGRVVWWRRQPEISMHRLAYEMGHRQGELRRQRVVLGEIFHEILYRR